MEWTKHKIPKIKDVLPLVNGIFGHCNYTFKYFMSKDQLDFLLLAKIGQRNPAPVIDLLHEQNDEEMDAMLTDAELTTLARIMLMQYRQKWDKLGALYDIEYDPIHNYLDDWSDTSEGSAERDFEENVDRVDTLNTTVTDSKTRTDNLSQTETRALETVDEKEFDNSEATTYGKSNVRTDDFDVTTRYGRSETETDDFDIAHTGDQTTTVQNDTTVNSLWGFNSSNDVNSDKSVNNGTTVRTDDLNEAHDGTITKVLSGSDTEEHDGTVTDALSGTDTTAYDGTVTDTKSENGTVTTTNTGTQAITGSEATTGTNRRDNDTTSSETSSDTRERSGRHTGNIGNLTSQKQILEEIELWQWNYVEQILDDAKEFLSLPVYL